MQWKMNKLQLVLVVVLFYSCTKTSENAKPGKENNPSTIFYTDITNLALKYPNQGLIKIELPFDDSKKLNFEMLKAQRLEILEILKKKNFKIVDSSFREVKNIKAFTDYSRSYKLENGNYHFYLKREYCATKLFNSYRIVDHLDYAKALN